MESCHRQSALLARRSIEQRAHDPAAFRAALGDVPVRERDVWLDLVLGLGELPEDGSSLPRGCVPYMPCSVDVLLRMIDEAEVHASDVFVDIGSGLGRAGVLVHLLTGASALGLEIQPELVRAARELVAHLCLPRVSFIEGDAAQLMASVSRGTVFFLYCPFGGERLLKVLEQLESCARTRMLSVCCVDLPLPPCEWLATDASPFSDLAVYRSSLHPR